MTELDDDQRRALRFFEVSPKEGIVEWFQTSEIGRATLKTHGRKLTQLAARRADDSEA